MFMYEQSMNHIFLNIYTHLDLSFLVALQSAARLTEETGQQCLALQMDVRKVYFQEVFVTGIKIESSNQVIKPTLLKKRDCGCKYFYKQHISDYPLNFKATMNLCHSFITLILHIV